MVALFFVQTGTRIIYDRKFLLECRTSPLARTPPRGLPTIPGVTSPPTKVPDGKPLNGEVLNNRSSASLDSSNVGVFTPQTNKKAWLTLITTRVVRISSSCTVKNSFSLCEAINFPSLHNIVDRQSLYSFFFFSFVNQFFHVVSRRWWY